MRYRQALSAFVFVAALSLWTGGARADSMLHLMLGKPDISGISLNVQYSPITHILTASGAIGSLVVSTGSPPQTGLSHFYLNALIDNSGALINNSANLSVDFGGVEWFESGTIDPAHLTTVSQSNPSPVALGFGTGLIEFEFLQSAFGQNAPVPAAFSPIGVELHVSSSFMGFGNTLMSVPSTSDTAVVAPAPQVAASGAGLLGALGAVALLRKRLRRSVVPAT
jgi:hypothetical protein